MPTKAKRERQQVRVIDATARLSTPGSTPVTPPTRGRLYYAYEIPDKFLAGLPKIGDKVGWVRRHFPRTTAIKIGRDLAWYEADIVAFLESQRGAVSA